MFHSDWRAGGNTSFFNGFFSFNQSSCRIMLKKIIHLQSFQVSHFIKHPMIDHLQPPPSWSTVMLLTDMIQLTSHFRLSNLAPFYLKNNKGLTRCIFPHMFYFIALPGFHSALFSRWHFACHMVTFLGESKSDFCPECKLTNNNHHHKRVCCVWDQKCYLVVMATGICKGMPGCEGQAPASPNLFFMQASPNRVISSPS